MAKLRDRTRQIPGGLKFYVAETKWEPVPWSSFESIVDQLIVHLKGNPWLADKNNWSTERNAVSNIVDAYNAQLCVTMNWSDFISEGGGEAAPATPFRSRRSRLKNVVGGASTLVEWISSGAEAVPAELATHRASICCGSSPETRCPKNSKEGWMQYFTVPVAEAIRHELERRKDMNLSTPYDDQLQSCTACDCPLALKVHLPIGKIMGKLSAKAMADLDSRCWILLESAQ